MLEIIKDIDSGGFISAYNENIVIFKKANATRAEIASKGHNLILYPSPSGEFYFYVGEFVVSCIANLIDDYQYSKEADATIEGSKLVHEFEFDIKIYGGSAVIAIDRLKYKFLKSADSADLQIASFNNKILAPIQDLTYYKGYPFEYSVLKNAKVDRYLVNSAVNNIRQKSTQNIIGDGKHKEELMFFDWAGIDLSVNNPTSSFILGGIEFKAIISNITKSGDNISTFINSQIDGGNSSYFYTTGKYHLNGNMRPALYSRFESKNPSSGKIVFQITFIAETSDDTLPIEIAFFDAQNIIKGREELSVITDGSNFVILEELGGNMESITGLGTKKISYTNSRPAISGSGNAILASKSTTSTNSLSLTVIMDKLTGYEQSVKIAFAVKLPCVNNSVLQNWNGKTADKCGIYLKWLNQQGAYSYHLFDKTSINKFTAKSTGTIIDNSDEYKGLLDIGKKLKKQKEIYTKLHVNHMPLIESLLSSIEVYIYTAERYSKQNKWTRIRIVAADIQYKQKYNGIVPVTVTCELPEPLTQHL